MQAQSSHHIQTNSSSPHLTNKGEQLQHHGTPTVPTPSADTEQILVQEIPLHLIIGDSLASGTESIPRSITFTKGGLHINQVMRLLESQTQALGTYTYPLICSVTLIVGTNDLQQRRADNNLGLLQILNDFNHLLEQLRIKFTNASIGVLNIMPRTITSRDGVSRITLFNGVIADRVLRLAKVRWICLYEELLNPTSRHINKKYYKRDELNLNAIGRGILNSRIREFHSFSVVENYEHLSKITTGF